MLKRRLFTLLVLPAVSLFASPASQVLATPATPGFHAAVAMPNSSNGSEPSLAISNDGIRYVSWQSPGKFAGSADGVNFSALATPDTGASGDVTNAVSYSGALYNGQICGGGTILHSCIYRSLDGGGHWSTQNTLADMNAGAPDRLQLLPDRPLQQGLGLRVDRRRSDVDVPPRVAGRLRHHHEDRRQRRQDLLHDHGRLQPPSAHRIVGAPQR